MKKHIKLIALLLLISSCIENTNDNHVGIPTADSAIVQKIVWDTTAAFLMDSVVVEDSVYVPNKKGGSRSSYVLMPYQYHGDEVTDEMKNATWYVLSKGGNGHKLSKSEVKFERVFDAIADDDTTQKTGWDVTSLGDDDILLGNVVGLSEGAVSSATLKSTRINPGEQYGFNINGRDYRLLATGYKMEADNSSEGYIRNYKVYLEQMINGKVDRRILYATPYYNKMDSEMSILFVGDLNNDNKLDIVMNRVAYNSSTLILYMSGKKSEDLKVIAIHEAVGC